MASTNASRALSGFLPVVGGLLAAVVVGGALWLFAIERTPETRVQAASGMPIPGDQVKPPPVSIDLDSPGPTIVFPQQEPPVEIERAEVPEEIVVSPPPVEKGLPELQPAETIDRMAPDPRPALEEAKRAPAPQRVVRVPPPPLRMAEPPHRNVIVVVEPPRPENRPGEVVVYPRNEPARPAVRREGRRQESAETRRADRRTSNSRGVRKNIRPVDGDTMADWHRRFLTEP